MPKPRKPNASLVSKYLRKWDHLENYRLQESSLNLLFRRLCPNNKNIEHVLLKVSALNDFYSTNIFATYRVAKHIQTKNVDERLKAKDYSLVNDIARISIKKKRKNFYSFASKYCSHHEPNVYPIYDYFVERMLMYYKSANKFHPFVKKDLKNYKRFIEVIRQFRIFYGLEKFSLKQIDMFLWLAGKESFPRKYKR